MTSLYGQRCSRGIGGAADNGLLYERRISEEEEEDDKISLLLFERGA